MTERSSLGRWPITVEVPVAWGEMDAFGHVNNAVYLRWFESARIAYFERAGILARMQTDRVGPILGRATIDFRAPVVYPDTVRIAVTVLRIGTTSFVMGYRADSKAKELRVAEGESVVVMLDYRSNKKVEIETPLREAIASLEGTAG